ncbi:MAG: hypothetical protein JWP81_3286 [Ferruginibacter sp.]|nr:hypothetical protein [Ferruginibacter sp.]
MKTEKYIEQIKRLPKTGQQIIANKDGSNIVVYQAFNPQIANYAVANQYFGGNAYSFNRMSWIKPGFLWMMHRAGWATKEQQENVLAIHLPIVHFKTILHQATISSFKKEIFATENEWKEQLNKTEVRLQWDPDHDPYGNKAERKAIQLGMKGELLKKICTEWIVKIEDITDFVKVEYHHLENINELVIPFEEVIALNDIELEQRIGIIK